MQISELKPDTLVEHPELGVGKIVRLEREENQVVVSFQAEPEQRMSFASALRSLKSLPAEGLGEFLYNDTEEVLNWVYNHPLKLVSTTLVDLGGAGKAGEVKSRLAANVPKEVNWETWWDKVRPSVGKASDHFLVKQSKPIELVSVIDIPVEPLPEPKAAKPAGATRTRTVPARERAADLKQQSEAYSAGLKQQREAHDADSKLQRQNHAADLKQQREAYATELKLHQEAYATELERQRENHAADLKQQREAYAADLERKEREAERLRNQLQTLRAEMVAGRQKSNLEVRSGMLLRIGDIIQGTYHLEKSSEARLADVMQRLPMVLNDGDAELFGKVGDAVPYDPKFHHSPETVAAGSPVRLVAPGVIASGGSAGAPVLLKAKVTQKTGDN